MNLSYYLAHNRFLKKVINNHYKLNLPMELFNFSLSFFNLIPLKLQISLSNLNLKKKIQYQSKIKLVI